MLGLSGSGLAAILVNAIGASWIGAVICWGMIGETKIARRESIGALILIAVVQTALLTICMLSGPQASEAALIILLATPPLWMSAYFFPKKSKRFLEKKVHSVTAKLPKRKEKRRDDR